MQKLKVFNSTIFYKYHPSPSATNNSTHFLFVQEFLDFVDSVAAPSDQLLILGNYNLHFGSDADGYSRKVGTVLYHHDLVQHVSIPTHSRVHILDWIVFKKKQ